MEPLFPDPFRHEVRIVSALNRSRANCVVYEGFGRKVIGRAVQIRNRRCGHGMLVRCRIIKQSVRRKFGRRGVFLNG